MKIFKIELTVIILIYVIVITMSADLEINRKRPTGKNGWKNGKDSFKISPYFCNQDVDCNSFAGAKVKSQSDHCSCLCSSSSATFMFHDHEWGCQRKENVRTLLGFDTDTYILLKGENVDDRLPILNIGDRIRLDVPDDWSSCENVDIDVGSSRYIACDGSEVIFQGHSFTLHREERNKIKYYLKVESGTINTDSLRGHIIKLGIHCNKNGNQIQRALLFKYDGTLTCPISMPTIQPSVTTKPLITNVTLSPSSATSMTGYAASTVLDVTPTVPNAPSMISDIPPTVSDTLSTVTHIPPTVSNIPPMISEIAPTVPDTLPTVTYISWTVSYTSPTASKFPTVSEAQPTVSEAPRTTLVNQPRTLDTTTDSSTNAPDVARPSPGRRQSSGETSTSVDLIVGLTTSILVIVIIIVFSVYRRCYLTKKPSSNNENGKTKETVRMSPYTRPAHEPENENDYRELDFNKESAVYTSSYQVPYRDREAHFTNGDSDEGQMYAPLNIPGGPNVYGHRNNQEIVANDMKPQSNSPISVDQCVYGLMEEIIMAGFKGPVKDTETDTQPMYNVLEVPYLKASQGPGNCGTTSAEGPVDNTLEGPVNDKGTNTQLVDNVLKGPYLESAEEPSHYGALPIKEPVYNTLEGPANNIENDTQAMYMSSTCSKEPFYNTLERPVQSNYNDTQPVYSILEAPDLEGAAGASRYSAMSPKGPIYNTVEESYPDNTNKLDSEITNEPIYNVLEEEPLK